MNWEEYNAIMEYKFCDSKTVLVYKSQIWQLLCECNMEFCPPLSNRNSSHQANLKNYSNIAQGKPVDYFNGMIKQNFIICLDENDVVGFMSYIPKYNCTALSKYKDSLYITTVCVRKKYRNQGILNYFYECLYKYNKKYIKSKNITTRTWSTNIAQIKSLSKNNYKLILTLIDDRGNGVDTLYFVNQ